MKIVQKDVVTQSVSSVVITLGEFEAGYLRTLLWRLVPSNVGFATELFNELDRLELPEYDKQHKNWRQVQNKE